MKTISDTMNPLTFKEGTYGRIYSEDYSPSVRGHIRSLDYYSDATYGLRPSLLGDVRAGVGASVTLVIFTIFGYALGRAKEKPSEQQNQSV